MTLLNRSIFRNRSCRQPVRGVHHRLGQPDLGAEFGRRFGRVQRLGQIPQRLIQPQQRLLSGAGGEGRDAELGLFHQPVAADRDLAALDRRGDAAAGSGGSYVRSTTTSFGGAVLYSTGCTVKLTNCSLISNSAQVDNGGAEYYFDNCVSVLDRCTFRSNTAGRDGGAQAFGTACSLTAGNTSYLNNTASGDGGGIFAASASRTASTTACQISSIR